MANELAASIDSANALDQAGAESDLSPPMARASSEDGYAEHGTGAASLDYYDLENKHLMAHYLDDLEEVDAAEQDTGRVRRSLRRADRQLAFRRGLHSLFHSDATRRGVARAKKARRAAGKAQTGLLRQFQAAEGAAARAAEILRQRALHDPRLRTVGYWTGIGFATGEIRDAIEGSNLDDDRTLLREARYAGGAASGKTPLPWPLVGEGATRMLQHPARMPRGGPRERVLKVYTSEVQGSLAAGDEPNILVVDPADERDASRPNGYQFRVRVGWSDEAPGQALSPSVGRVNLCDMYLTPVSDPGDVGASPATPEMIARRRTGFTQLSRWTFLGDEGSAYVPFTEDHTGTWQLVLVYELYDEDGNLQPAQRHSLALNIKTRAELAAHYARLAQIEATDEQRLAALAASRDRAITEVAMFAPENPPPTAGRARIGLINPTEAPADALRVNPDATVPYSFDYLVPSDGRYVRDETCSYDWTLTSLRGEAVPPVLAQGGPPALTPFGDGVWLPGDRAYVNLPPALVHASGTYLLQGARYARLADGSRGAALETMTTFVVVQSEAEALQGAQLKYFLRRTRIAEQSGTLRPLHAGFALNLEGYETRHRMEPDAVNARRIPLDLWYTDTDIGPDGDRRRGICVWDLGGGVGAGMPFSGQGESLDAALRDLLDKRQLPAGTLWVVPPVPPYADYDAARESALFATDPGGYASDGPSTWDAINQVMGLVSAASGVAAMASQFLAPVMPQARYAVPVFTLLSMATATATAGFNIGLEAQKYRPDGLAIGLNVANLMLVMAGAGMWAKAGLTREGHAVFSLTTEQRLAIGMEAGDHLVMAAEYAYEFATLADDNTQDRDVKLASFLLNVVAGLGLSLVSELAPGARPNTHRHAPATTPAVTSAGSPGHAQLPGRAASSEAQAALTDIGTDGQYVTIMSSFVDEASGARLDETLRGDVFERRPDGTEIRYHRVIDEYHDDSFAKRTDVLVVSDDEGNLFRFDRDEGDGRATARLIPMDAAELAKVSRQAGNVIYGVVLGVKKPIFVIGPDGARYKVPPVVSKTFAVMMEVSSSNEFVVGKIVNGDKPMLHIGIADDDGELADSLLIDFDGVTYHEEAEVADGSYLSTDAGLAYHLHGDTLDPMTTDGFFLPDRRDKIIMAGRIVTIGRGPTPMAYDHLQTPLGRVTLGPHGEPSPAPWEAGDVGAVFAMPGLLQDDDRTAGKLLPDGSIRVGRIPGDDHTLFIPADRHLPAEDLLDDSADDRLTEHRFHAVGVHPLDAVVLFGRDKALYQGAVYTLAPTTQPNVVVGLGAEGQPARLFLGRDGRLVPDTSPGIRTVIFERRTRRGRALGLAESSVYEVIYDDGLLYEVIDIATTVRGVMHYTCRTMIREPVAAAGQEVIGSGVFSPSRDYRPGQYHFYERAGDSIRRVPKEELELKFAAALPDHTPTPEGVRSVRVKPLGSGAEIAVLGDREVVTIVCEPVPPSPRPGYRYPTHEEIAAAFQSLPMLAARSTSRVTFADVADNAAFHLATNSLVMGLRRESDTPSSLRHIILHECLGHGTQADAWYVGLRMVLRAAELDGQPMPRTYAIGPEEMWTTSLEAWDNALQRGAGALASFERERPHISALIRAVIGGTGASVSWLVLRVKSGLFGIIPLIYAFGGSVGGGEGPEEEDRH